MLHPMFDSGSDSNKLPNAIPQHLYEPNMLSAMSPLTTPQAASFGGSDMAGSFNSVHSDFSELTSPNGIMPGIIQGGSGNMDDTMGVGGLSNCSMYDAQTSGQPESQQNMSLNIPQTAPAGSIGFGYTGFSLPTHSNLSFSMPADNFGSYFRDSGGSLAAFPPSSSSSTGQNNFLQDPLMSAAAVAAASAATKMVLDERLEHPPHRRKRTLTNDSTDSLSNMPLLERASLETDNSIGQMIGCNNDERVYADLISSFSICQNNAAADLGGYAFLDNGFSLSSSMNIHQDVAGNNGPPHGLAGVDDGGIAPELTIYQQAGASTKKSNGCGYNQEKNVTTNI
ncbi:hypothetical protein LPJ66_000184 [Kickxella alabastrina]|uniref:Uncharacterized protein n=1 Tax=Kickxella alabastrina TaxID=61397 RepID=A0ACC1IWL8_9FUNG|nr:hypothetical protein LPJ66_000184 [Kickxella alabastrina]